jgi:predicted MFS family arabinose efflux permease
LLYGIIEAPVKGWGNAAVLTAFAVGAVLLVSFIVLELRSDHPMLDVRFFKNPRFSGASFAIALVFFAMFGVSFLLTQYLQFVLHYSALKAGLGFIPLAAALMLSAPISTPVTQRTGTKATVAGGMGAVALALFLLSQATTGTGYIYVAVILTILGLGMGMAMAPATDAIMGSLPQAKAGVGSAVNDTTRQVGGALGVAILGSLTSAVYHSGIAGSKVVSALPAAARAGAHDSLGGAVQVASHLGASGQQLVLAANHAFVHAMSITAFVAAGVALAGALVALLFLPSRPVEEPVEQTVNDVALAA